LVVDTGETALCLAQEHKIPRNEVRLFLTSRGVCRTRLRP
jgi:hypothetical protein